MAAKVAAHPEGNVRANTYVRRTLERRCSQFLIKMQRLSLLFILAGAYDTTDVKVALSFSLLCRFLRFKFNRQSRATKGWFPSNKNFAFSFFSTPFDTLRPAKPLFGEECSLGDKIMSATAYAREKREKARGSRGVEAKMYPLISPVNTGRAAKVCANVCLVIR